MLSTSIFLGLATALFWGVCDFLSRQPSKEIGFYLTTAYMQVSALAVIFLYALFFGYLNIPLILGHGYYSLASLAIGVVAYVALLFIFRGYSLGNMAIVAPIAGSYPAVTALLSFLILGEILLPVQSYAIAITIVGIVLSGTRLSEFFGFRKKISSSTSEGLKIRTRLIVGADSALVAALSGGTAFFALGFVTPVLGPVIPPLLIKVSGLIVGFAIIPLLRQQFKRPSKQAILWLSIIGILDGVGFVTLNTGILEASAKDLPIVVTMAALMSVVTSMLASIFYNEKLEKIQILGIALIIIGVASIVYF
jgi:drug/metabolite transporter (DMT)-like permease